MRIRCAIFCLCLGWSSIGRGEDLATSMNPTDASGIVQSSDRGGTDVRSAGDVTDVSEYLQAKFQIPASPAPETPPGSNDLTTTDGQIYRNVQTWKVEPDGVTFRHDEGLTKLEFPLLPEDWRKRYAYDPEEAAAYRRVMADAMQEAERTQQQLRQQMQSELDAQKPE